MAALIEAGIAHQEAGRFAEALEAFERSLEARPDHAKAHLLAGIASFRLGRWDKGVAHTRAAVAAAPADAGAWSNLAFGLRTTGRTAEASQVARHALKLDPELANGWNVLGLAEQDSGRLEEARGHFVRALELNARFAEARVNLANCDQALGRIEAALDGYREAAALDPALVEAPYNRGHLYHKATGDIEAAIACYREAIAVNPGFALAHNNLAHALFLTGRFPEAWREYRWRPNRLQLDARMNATGRRYAPPQPGSLGGSRLVIVGEQGLGDMLFFLRYAPLVRSLGVELGFAGDVRLHGMLGRSGLFERFAAGPDEANVRNEAQVLAGDLPLVLPEDGLAHAVPALALTADAGKLAQLRERLASLGPPPYAALAWRSGIAKTGIEERLFKELPLEGLGAALRGLPATWLSIQREPRSGETEALAGFIGARVHDLSGINEDLEEALAAMALLDHVIGVSNTNVHLRAGAGGPARVLVPFPPEWRWMQGERSLWFPDMPVYRQERSGSWQAAFASLAADLRRAASSA